MALSNLLAELDWRAPAWLLLALQPLLILALRRWQTRRSAQRFAAPALLPWVRLRQRRRYTGLRSYAHVIAWLLVALAAAGPRLPQLEPGQTLRAGVDWMLAVDVSHSMEATDVAPSRLKRARIEIQQLLPQLRGDRVGLTLYAGQAHLVAPPTHDLDALVRYLSLLQTDLLPSRGSRPEHALDLARNALAEYPDNARAVLLVTDHAGDPAVTTAAARRLREDGIDLYVFGMGSAGGVIDEPDDDGGTRNAIPVPLEQRALASLADAGGGRYATVSDDASDLQQLYQQGIAVLAKPRAGMPDPADLQWRELYPWLLLPALILFAATLLPYRSRTGGALIGSALLGMAILHAPPSQAADDLRAQAFAAYHDGQYQTARDLYSRMTGFQARLGEGASAYRLRDFPRALREFSTAVLVATDDTDRAAALLNLGNSYFQLGDYRNAVTAFEDALRYRADFDGAQRNLALARLAAEAVARELAGSRPNRGRRTGEAERQSGPAPLTLGEEPTEPESSEAIASDIGDNELADLIARGLRHARVAAQSDRPDAFDVQQGAPSAAAVAHMTQLGQDPARLWRRIFELEEGFQAPLPQPRTLPGIAPW